MTMACWSAFEPAAACDLLAIRRKSRLTQPFGPVVALAAVYIVASILTELMSNAAVAVVAIPRFFPF